MNTHQIKSAIERANKEATKNIADFAAEVVNKAKDLQDQLNEAHAANCSLVAFAAVVREHSGTPESLKAIASKELLNHSRGSHLLGGGRERWHPVRKEAHTSEEISPSPKKPVNDTGRGEAKGLGEHIYRALEIGEATQEGDIEWFRTEGGFIQYLRPIRAAHLTYEESLLQDIAEDVRERKRAAKKGASEK